MSNKSLQELKEVLDLIGLSLFMALLQSPFILAIYLLREVSV